MNKCDQFEDRIEWLQSGTHCGMNEQCNYPTNGIDLIQFIDLFLHSLPPIKDQGF